MKRQTNELLSPKNDIVFQTLFSRVNETITRTFLSDILGMEITKINLNVDKNLSKYYPEKKLGILDLRAELNDGIQCDVEIQLIQTESLIARLLSYWARLYVENLNQGEEYDNLKRTICILILDDRIERFKNIDRSHTKWQIREEKENTTILTKDLEFHILELPKAIEEYERNPKSKVMQWMKFLENPEDKEVEHIMEENKEIKEAKEKLEEISSDEELRRIAFLEEKGRRDRADQMKDARKKGMREGIEEGMKEGVEQTNKKIVEKLYQKGLGMEEIAEIVGLPKDKVEQYIQ